MNTVREKNHLVLNAVELIAYHSHTIEQTDKTSRALELAFAICHMLLATKELLLY